jgi:predicted small secreted protein
MRLFIIILGLGFIASLATACNTMEGAGQDIQKGGESLERSADKHK